MRLALARTGVEETTIYLTLKPFKKGCLEFENRAIGAHYNPADGGRSLAEHYQSKSDAVHALHKEARTSDANLCANFHGALDRNAEVP
jgi:hypothetical protein